MEYINDNDYNVSYDNHKGLKTLIIVLIVLTLIVIIATIGALAYVEEQRFKFIVDGVEIKEYSEDLFKFEEGSDKPYVNIREFASMIGYKTYKGDYKAYEEDVNFCYVQDDFEIASFEYDSKRIYKTTPGENNDYEYFQIENEVKKIDDKLYTTEEGIEIGCNVEFDYKSNTINVTTMNFLRQQYIKTQGNALVENKNETELKLLDLNEGLYNYSKCMLYNMLVVRNDKNELGVITLDGKEAIGTKYKNIKFIESEEMFLVTTNEGKVGMVSATGETKIKPEYDKVKLLDKDMKLYLVEEKDKKGIVNNVGDTIVYVEYDEIGIDANAFKGNEIKNQYLLYDNYVPVKRDNKWGVIGIFNSKVQEVIPIKFDALGSNGELKKDGDKKDESTSSAGIILIPGFKAFVVNNDEYFGIINVKGEELVPVALSAVYSIRKNGKIEYWMTYNENDINIIDYLKKFYLDSNSEDTSNATVNTTNEAS